MASLGWPPLLSRTRKRQKRKKKKLPRGCTAHRLVAHVSLHGGRWFLGSSHRQRADSDAGFSSASRVHCHRSRTSFLVHPGVLTAICGTQLYTASFPLDTAPNDAWHGTVFARAVRLEIWTFFYEPLVWRIWIWVCASPEEYRSFNALGDDFWLFPCFGTMRGSTVDSCTYASPGGLRTNSSFFSS